MLEEILDIRNVQKSFRQVTANKVTSGSDGMQTENLNEGYTWVVELDLEKFFNKVNHDKLMSLISGKIKEKRTLKLIRSDLSCGIMENGWVTPRRGGTPQVSPLSLFCQTLF
jgi:retron-type reverse transcriptase